MTILGTRFKILVLANISRLIGIKRRMKRFIHDDRSDCVFLGRCHLYTNSNPSKNSCESCWAITNTCVNESPSTSTPTVRN